MISFDDARSRIHARVEAVSETERLSVARARGRVLAEEVVSAIDAPNHDNSAMDGFAVRFEDLNPDGSGDLMVVADLPAGDLIDKPLQAGEAVRIMTGAPIPPGCDCVVMQEKVTRGDGGKITIRPGQAKEQNIRRAGEDITRGAVVLEKGRRITPADQGLLTVVGRAEVEVYRRLKVGVLSTGNEVTPPGEPLVPGHVYDSNRIGLLGALEGLGVEVLDLGLARDVREEIEGALRKGAEEADVLITSGGVSVGDFDLVKDVIDDLGAIDFWKVGMKPGKPQAYGELGGAAFFGLPGNPVASLVVFQLMVRPCLLKMMGAQPEPDERFQLPLKGHLKKKFSRMDFQRGVVTFDPAGAYVETTGVQGSGILSSMSRANALIALHEGTTEVNDGDLVDVWMIRYG